MKKRAVLVVSFGTTKDETRKKNIDAVEQEIKNAYPEEEIRRAFTSSIVIRRLAERGIKTDTVGEALARLTEEGFRRIYLLPTHILPGEEYEKLARQTEPYLRAVETLRIARPLLDRYEDMADVAEAILSAYPKEEGEALLLMGHGARHFANCVYPAMEAVLNSHGGDHAFVATVEGKPELKEALERILKGGYKAVHLAPLMLVAGEHALEDMAGESEDSWKQRCLSAGLSVRCSMAGLGEFPAVRKRYVCHLEDCMRKDETRNLEREAL